MLWEKDVAFLVILTRKVKLTIMQISVIQTIRLTVQIKTITQINVIQTTLIVMEDKLLVDYVQMQNKK